MTKTAAPAGRKASTATGGTIQKKAAQIFFGRPLEEARRALPRRGKVSRPKLDPVLAFLAYTGFLVLAIFTAITAAQLYLTPSNPGWYAVLWVFAWATIMVGGHLFALLPKSAMANGLMLATFVAGFAAIPFAVQFLVTKNIGVLIVTAPFIAAFAIVLNHYLRACTLHREGYLV